MGGQAIGAIAASMDTRVAGTRMADPALELKSDVEAEVRQLETRIAELEGQGFQFSNVEEGVMEEGVPSFESPEGRPVEKGMNFTGDHEEGQWEDDVPAYEMATHPGAMDPGLSWKEREAIRAKGEHIADGLEGCENLEEGQLETHVPAYELKGCTVM